MENKHGGKRPGAGRKPGSVDTLTRNLRNKISGEEIIEFLNDVALGNEVNARVGKVISEEMDDFYEGPVKPTIEQRMKAAEVLMRKALPDLKAVEHSGDLNIHEAVLDDLE